MRTLALTVILGSVVMACAALPANDDTSSTSDELATKKDAGTDAGGGLHDVDDVSIIVEPSDHGAALVAAITAATTSVHMTMYDLSMDTAINALIARHKAGVDVKVILNSKAAMPGPNPNQYAFDTLQKAGVPVVWSPSTYEFTHEKCVVIDGKTTWVMTMNASESSPVDNREYLAVDNDADIVVEAEAQFAADFANKAYAPSGRLLMSPVTMRPGLEALIGAATKTLDFEVEEFNDPDLATALCTAVTTHHVAVRGLLSSQALSSPGKAALAQLKACGVKMSTLATPYIHAKAIVIDGTQAYVGSANFSTTSLDQNRELGLVTSNAAAVAAVNTSLTADIGNGTAL